MSNHTRIIIDHWSPWEMEVFSPDLQYDFRSSWSAAGLLTVVSYKVAKLLLIGLGLVKLWHLIYSKFLAGFGMLVFFINSSLITFQFENLSLFHLFSVFYGIKWFGMGSLIKNIQLILSSSRLYSWSNTFPAIH